MNRTEFIRTRRTFGLDLAICAARTAGISRAVVDLWALSAR